MGLSASLALGDPTVEVSPSRGPVMGLRERNAVKDGVESTVAAAVEAVARASRRGSFQWGSAGVSRELGIGLEPVTRPEDAGERASCEQVDAAETTRTSSLSKS